MECNNESVAKSKVLTSLLSCGNQLSPEWKAITTTDQRIYFVNRRTRSSHWFPPPEFWASKVGLPYGWEAALDNQSKKYYINHVTRTTTREDPRSEADQAAHLHMSPPQARRIELVRDAKIGFGFVAGSEKPVVIRSVIPNGPSHEKLFANDQILKVNGKDVRDASQADVISLIKSAVGSIELEVVASEDVQDTNNQHNRKSSLMSRTTRERRRSTPVSVRFADEPALVQLIGPTESVRRSSVPLIPNVLKVFLENGQTRSFRYDSNTTADEIFSSFSSKLDVKLIEHFSLVLTGPKKGQISYIQNNEKVCEIYTNRNCSSVNCLCKLNIAFVPKDHFELLSQDPNTFEYLYAQVTNMVVEGFYGMDLKYDLAIKLAALHIQQKAMEAAAGRQVKISVRQVEKEFGGLGKFVSSDLLHSMREKELRKILDQQIKQNENLASPGERHMSSLQCKLHYLNLVVEMFSYGGRYFDAELVDSSNEGPSLKKTKKQHVTLLVNLKYGVSQVVRGKVNVLCQLAEFHEITGFAIRLHEDNKRLLQIKVQEGKKIQLVCTTVDCLDIIALVTGYYKVYVDNTSNIPLPVQNEEKWPFAFLRDPPVNNAPDFYSRHRVVPDVWSYPYRFQTSNPKSKTQPENTNPLNGHKEVFIDLSKAPPRFNETAISEEPEDDNMVAEETNRDQKDGNTSDGESLNQEDDISELVMSDEDRKLLETATSFLKSSSEDINTVNDQTQSDDSNGSKAVADNEELFASRKRRLVFSGSPGKENAAIKSAKTTLTENVEEDQDDLISELILAEAIWQEEEAGVVAVDAVKEPVELVSTDRGDSCVVVGTNSEESNAQAHGAVGEQKRFEVAMGKPGQLSANNVHSQSGDTEKIIDTSNVVNNDLFACFHSGDYGQGTTDVNQNILSNNSITKTASLAEHNEYMRPAVSGAEFNLHLDLSEQHDPFIITDPFQDRSPTPSPRDLGFDESKFDNKGIELADFVECGVKTQGLVEQQSVVSVPEKRIAVEGKGSDGNRSKSPVTLELRGDSSPVSDDDIFNKNKPVDLDNLNNSVASHMVSLEFVEGSETETESAMSDEGESLWSTFPEFFQPSRRLTYSSNKQAELSLAEEDQDADGLDFTETDRDVALVSIKNLSTEDESNSKHSVEISARQDGVLSLADDWDDLSTASSESFEYTYEVNAEFPSESEEASEDSGYVYLRDENDRGVEGIFDQNKNGDDFPSHISTVSLDTYISDKCDTSVDTFSSLDVKSSKVDEPTESSLTETTPFYHFDQGDFSEKNEFVEMSKSVSREESLRALPGSRQGIDVSRNLSDESLKHVLLGRSEIINKGWRSLNDSEDKGMMLDRSYSPSDWIIPSPPTPTPELQEADIHIVSPPPFSPTSVEDELDDELKHLIVPPPPSSVVTLPIVSGIRIVSPPPLDVNDCELDHLMYDYDDIRFLSLTDDHKLAKNNGLVSARSFDSNFTEDKKIQAQMVEMVSKEGGYARKSIAISNRDRSILNPSGNSCNTNHTPIKQSFATYALTSRSLDSQSFLPNPPTSCSSTSLVNAHTTWKRFGEKKHPLDDFPNKEVVNSPNLKNGEDIRGKINSSSGTDEFNKISNTNQRNNNRSRVPLKPKPPVPPKPRMFRTVSSEGKMDKADAIPGKSMKMSLDEDRGIVVEGYHKNKPVRSAADENHRNINAELGEAGRSSLDSLPQRERDLVHSNHSSRSPSTSPSAGQAPNKALAKYKKTQVHDSVNSCNVKLSADSILNTHLDSPYAKSTDISKEKSSQRLEAFRPALSTASNPVALRASCPDTPAIDSPSSTADDILYKNEFNSQRDKHGTRRSSSFTCRSPYVPAPYSSSRTQSLYSAQSSVEKAHKSAPHSNRSSSAGSPTVNSGASRGTYANLPRVNSCFETATSSVSAAPPSSGNKPHSAGMEPLFNPQQPTSHLSFRDSNNSSGDDTNRALPKPPSESSSLRLATVELQEDSCNDSLNPPPLPDSPPPPLPDSSPPKTIPVFDTDDFDFGESLIETFQDGIQMDSLETTTFDLPSSPNDVESKRSSASVDYKQEDSKCTFPERRDKRCGGNGLSRSLTITSIPRDINRRSLSEDWPSLTGASIRDSRTKRCSFPFNECFNLDDATAAGSLNYLEECQPEFLKAKCSKVCEEGLLKVSNLKKRLEPYLNGRASKPQLSKETKNWPLIFQNNARFLACDIKVISSSVKRGSPQFVSAMETSLDSLEKLVESCEKTYSTLNEKSNHNGRTLAVMVNEVLDQYRDIIFTVKAASGQPPDDPDVEVLVKKTNAVATLIASLIRTLRKY